MRQITCEPTTEISGVTILSFLKCLGVEEFAPLIQKYGYTSIDPTAWYPLQPMVDLFAKLATLPTQVLSLVDIGMNMAESARIPPQAQNVPFQYVLEGWDSQYQANFRNGPVGHKTAVKLAPNYYKILHTGTMLPDDLEYGMLYGFAKRFLPPGTHFRVWYDESVTQMDEGGTETVIHVRWES